MKKRHEPSSSGDDAKEISNHIPTSDEAYRTLVDSSIVGLAIFQDNKIVFGNEKLGLITGYTVAELLAMTPEEVFSMVPAEDRARHFEDLQKRLSGEALPSRKEMRIVQKNGAIRWVEGHAKLITYQGRKADQVVYVDIHERKLLEQKVASYRDELEQKIQERSRTLAESEERYHLIFENSPTIMIIGVMENLLIYDVNQAYLEALGIKNKKAFLNSRPRLGDRGLSAEYTQELFVRLKRERRLYDIPYQGVGPGNQVLDLRVSAEVFEMNGEELVVLNIVDVTELLKTQSTLITQERFYRSLIDSSRDAYVFIAPDTGEILDCNEAYLEMLGYTRDELVGRPFYTLTPERWHTWEKEEIIEKRLLVKGYSGVYEKEYIRKDGTVFPVELTAYRYAGDESRDEMLWCVVREITARKKAEQTLIESERRFRTVADYTYDWEYWRLPNGAFEYMSPSAERITGHPPEAFYDDPDLMTKIIHSEDRRRFDEHWNHHGKTETSEIKFRLLHRDGTTRWIHHTCRSMLDTNDMFIGIRASNRDVTVQTELEEQRRAAEEKARQHEAHLLHADKLASLGVLVSGVAHEINNPNNFIMLNASMLRVVWKDVSTFINKHEALARDFEPGGTSLDELNGTIQTLVDGISDGAERIKAIVGDLKGYARKEDDGEVKPVELNKVVIEAVKLLKIVIDKSTDSFRLVLPDAPVSISGNAQRLTQVVVNLLQNACEALTSREDSIYVSLTSGDIDCTLTVCDTGRGIPKAHLKNVTDPFFTTKRETGGTGLGLSVSAGIIESHGGKLRFESNRPRGTRVTVVFKKHEKNLNGTFA